MYTKLSCLGELYSVKFSLVADIYLVCGCLHYYSHVYHVLTTGSVQLL